MTQREKLIELLDNKICNIDLVETEAIWTKDKLADLADQLIANGVMVPPCKVGDTVYYIYEDYFYNMVLSYFVENMTVAYYDKSRNYVSFEANAHSEDDDHLIDSIDFELEDIGKTVFLTCEEAERALKERESNG